MANPVIGGGGGGGIGGGEGRMAEMSGNSCKWLERLKAACYDWEWLKRVENSCKYLEIAIKNGKNW